MKLNAALEKNNNLNIRRGKFKVELISNKRKVFTALGVLIIILVLPITLILVRQSQDSRGKAATPDKLETEQGMPSSTGVQKLSDSLASGGEYIKFVTISTPTPTVNKQAIAKFFIFKNIEVCNTNNTCLNLELDNAEVGKIRSEINGFKSDVDNWSEGKLIINPVIIEINDKKIIDMTDAYGNGWWLSPSDSRKFIKDDVTKDTDFTFVIHGVYDKAQNETLDTRYCDLTPSASWNAIGTGYT